MQSGGPPPPIPLPAERLMQAMRCLQVHKCMHACMRPMATSGPTTLTLTLLGQLGYRHVEFARAGQ